ncbi:STE3-like pheromone receptor [Rickenella mellea]|uniref:STE3-like pheromone receptor n=1 Tax=Rickenella mellea TaxID=50990 RepID=A0A4Y7PK13_9AGAM|nr:STE3-like pheromone receptor [Rickenella mellea]
MDLHPTVPIFPIMIFLSFVAMLLPWAWIKRDNTGILFLSLWIAIACLNQFVNSVIYPPSRVIVGISVAIPASALCMARRLYHICSMKAFLLTPTQKRRALIEDLCICLGIPILQMAIGHRFNILEDIGCYPAAYNVWLTYVLCDSWTVIIGIVSAIYSVARNGKEIDKFIEDKVDRKHYDRLIILSSFVIIFDAPFTVVIMIVNLTTMPLYPYIGWEDTHFNYSRVDEIPAAVWRSDAAFNAKMEMARWILVLLAILFYGLFGFSTEAMNVYKKGFWTVSGFLGIKNRPSSIPQEILPQ